MKKTILVRYTAKFGALHKRYEIDEKLLAKSLRTGRDEYADLRKFLAEVTKRRLQTLKKRAPEYAARRKQERANEELSNAYAQKFGFRIYGIMYKEIYAAMKRALKTGIDQPELIQRRADIEESIRTFPAREAARKAEQAAYVFTAKDEKDYTGYIKKRKLWEGACDLNWPKYRAYRAKHPGCEPLDAVDLRYVGQWTGVLGKRRTGNDT